MLFNNNIGIKRVQKWKIMEYMKDVEVEHRWES